MGNLTTPLCLWLSSSPLQDPQTRPETVLHLTWHQCTPKQESEARAANGQCIVQAGFALALQLHAAQQPAAEAVNTTKQNAILDLLPAFRYGSQSLTPEYSNRISLVLVSSAAVPALQGSIKYAFFGKALHDPA
jgi:hypothetical protein